MEMIEGDGGLSVPRGGPIYVPNMVGPLTRVPYFQASLLRELQDLEAELCLSSSSIPDNDDISVDDLKIFTEEELADMALKEAFKDADDAEKNSKQPEKNSKKLSQEHSGSRIEDNHKESSDKEMDLERCERGENTSASLKSSNGNPSRAKCNANMTRKKSRKKKRRKTNDRAVEDGYIVKVEQLAKIKQRQDEDRAAARLHSLNINCKINGCATPSLDRVERMISLRSTNYATKLMKPGNIPEYIAVTYPEVVLCVEVYHNIRKWLKTQEFLVLGQQTLTELRDKIYCSTDQMMKKAEQHDPSGYFLIEDVFCNDLRDQSAIDYSEPIFDWLRNSKDDALRKWECILTGELKQKERKILGEVKTSHLADFKAVDMHTTRFSDLRFRLGAGYLYCHQGDCKHMIVIRDMRLIHPEDIHDRAAYPVGIFQLKPRVRKCSVCKIYRATKVTVNDKWAKQNPCYFCDYCYSLLHPKDESVLCNDFSVYDYLHD